MSGQRFTVFIHIGTHKTGTTSIQYFLDHNRDLLKKSNILYPVTGIPDKINLYGHHRLAGSFTSNPDEIISKEWSQLKTEIYHENKPVIVISSEDFYTHIRRIAFLNNEYEDLEVKIIIYLRSYLGFTRALYFENIKKNNFSAGFSTFILARKNHINYNERLGKLSTFFGKENLIIRIYDSIDPGEGLLKDFCELIGFDYSLVKDQPERRLNITVPDKTILIIRALNKIEKWLPRIVSSKLKINEMRKALAGNHMPNSLLIRFLTVITGNKIYSSRDIRQLRKIISEFDQELLLEKVGEEGLLLLKKGL